MSLEFYADIVKQSDNKVETFCECVDVMNIKGNTIKKFARMCDFPLVSVHDIKEPLAYAESRFQYAEIVPKKPIKI